MAPDYETGRVKDGAEMAREYGLPASLGPLPKSVI